MAQLVTAMLAQLEASKTVSQPQWSDYEAGKTEPAGIVYRAVGLISGLPEAYLAFGESGVNDAQKFTRAVLESLLQPPARRVAEPAPAERAPQERPALTDEEKRAAKRAATKRRA